MNIRRAVKNDLENILQLFKETINSVNQKDYSDAQIKAWVSGSTHTEKWIRRIEQQYFLVAEMDRKLLGFASISQKGYLDLLFIHKNHQRKAIAQKLYGRLEEFAVSKKVKEISSDVSITARGFFEQQGFRVIKTQTVEREGVEIKNFRMIKFL